MHLVLFIHHRYFVVSVHIFAVHYCNFMITGYCQR